MKRWDSRVTVVASLLLGVFVLGLAAVADAGEGFAALFFAAIAAFFAFLEWLRRQKARSPAKQIDWVALQTTTPVSDLLNWRTRLAPLIGRDKEKKDLLDWATGGGGVELRFLNGPGGSGKSRLAAEVATDLTAKGWTAGLAKTGADELLPKATGKQLFLIVDYPEDDPEATRRVLDALIELPVGTGPVRVLLVSRYSQERWEEQNSPLNSQLISLRPKSAPLTLTLQRLSDEEAVELFRRTLDKYVEVSGEVAIAVSEESILEWLRKGRDKDLFHLPLFLVGAAIHCVLTGGHRIDLTSADVMRALVSRETRRMREFGHEDRLVERLVTLATLRLGLEAVDLRTIQQAQLPGLSFTGKDIVDWAKTLDWWSGDALQPLRPDPLGAALVFEVLKDRTQDAPAWLWSVLGAVPTNRRSEWLAAAERIDYDIRRIYGWDEQRFAGWLAAMVGGDGERASRLEFLTPGASDGGHSRAELGCREGTTVECRSGVSQTSNAAQRPLK